MIKTMLVGAAAILIASASTVSAGHPGGASTYAPGHKMKTQRSMGPGASTYAPGQRMKEQRSVSPGASKYAPGHKFKKPSGKSGTMSGKPTGGGGY